MDGQGKKNTSKPNMDRKKRHIQVKHGWKKKTHPSEWNMDKKKQVNVKETFALPGCFRSVGKHLDAGQRREDDRIVAQRGRASELCVLFALRSSFAIRLLTSLLAKQREMIGVGRSKQNLNVVDRPLGKGKTEVQFFFPPLFFWLPVLLFFFCKETKNWIWYLFLYRPCFWGLKESFVFIFLS